MDNPPLAKYWDSNSLQYQYSWPVLGAFIWETAFPGMNLSGGEKTEPNQIRDEKRKSKDDFKYLLNCEIIL